MFFEVYKKYSISKLCGYLNSYSDSCIRIYTFSSYGKNVIMENVLRQYISFILHLHLNILHYVVNISLLLTANSSNNTFI